VCRGYSERRHIGRGSWEPDWQDVVIHGGIGFLNMNKRLQLGLND